MFDYEIRELTTTFYLAYPSSKYSEIVTKNIRPYDVAVFDTPEDFYICIPFRSYIRHSYCYHFKHSMRSQVKQSGLDYTKIVIVKNESYIGKCTVVDNDEAKELRMNAVNIHKDALKYVNGYINHLKGTKILASEEFNRRYKYTTLSYFHAELGIE